MMLMAFRVIETPESIPAQQRSRGFVGGTRAAFSGHSPGWRQSHKEEPMYNNYSLNENGQI